MKDMTVTYHLDLVGHIKQYLDEYKSSMFHKTDEIENIINKIDGGEELSVDELISIVDHRFRIEFKKNILEKASLILPDDSKDIQDLIHEGYSEMGIYLLYESYYVMKLLEDAPKIISRAISLRGIFITESPSQRVKEFCKEAYLSYISGNYIASAVLMRSIVETIFFEKFALERCQLWEINDAAKEIGIYNYDIWEKVDNIRLEVNNMLHNIIKVKITEEKNKDIIKITQTILEYFLDDNFKVSILDQDRIKKLIEKRREERKNKKTTKKYYRNPRDKHE